MDREVRNRDDFPWSHKQISGALRSCINDHGPITSKTVQSATKRIISQLYGATAPTRVAERLEAAARREEVAKGRIADLEAERERLESKEAELTDDLAAERDRAATLALSESQLAEKVKVLKGLAAGRERLREAVKTYADRENWYDDSVEGDVWDIAGERGWEPAQRALGDERG